MIVSLIIASKSMVISVVLLFVGFYGLEVQLPKVDSWWNMLAEALELTCFFYQ